MREWNPDTDAAIIGKRTSFILFLEVFLGGTESGFEFSAFLLSHELLEVCWEFGKS